jgi:SulP family sulfate permease
MILFPLGQPIFEKLGAAGISMFYVSCIVSQLVYSCGGSIFKGGIGSEMVRLGIITRINDDTNKQ